ncbi:hypothetical protein B9Z55_007311 [Caenorhabditis nigoni]|uniref:Uncharacterized protein n=1 Tax=Caenorhabditis nigoni TaxID=1611254 RepID=A0A2G5V904_9PELO|nr:hypothetical protein B9Z55_007311 [Caenorhabditis nigoni]
MSNQNVNHAYLGFGTNGVPLIGSALPAYPVGVDALTQFFANMADQNANHALLGFGTNGAVPFKSANAFPAGVDPLPQFLANMDRHEQNKEESKNQARILELEHQNKELAEQIAKSNSANVPLGQAHRRIGELEQEMIENAKLVQKLGEEKENQTLVIEKLGSEKAEISKQVEAQNLKIEKLETANKKLEQDAQQQRDAHQMKINEQSEKMQKIEADLQNQIKLSANQKTSVEARDAKIGQLQNQLAEKNTKLESVQSEANKIEKELQTAQRQLIARQEALDSSERNAMDLKAEIDQLKKNHQAIIRGFENNIILLRQQLSNQANTMAKMRAANENAEKTTTGKLRQAHINNVALQTSLSEATGKYDLLRGVVAEQKQDLDAVNREVNNLKARCKFAEESVARAKGELQLQMGTVDELTKQLGEQEAAKDELQKKLDAFNSAKAAFNLATAQVDAAGTSDLPKGRKRPNNATGKAAPLTLLISQSNLCTSFYDHVSPTSLKSYLFHMLSLLCILHPMSYMHLHSYFPSHLLLRSRISSTLRSPRLSGVNGLISLIP